MKQKGPRLIDTNDVARSIESKLDAIAGQSRKALFSDAAAAFREIKRIRRAVRQGGDPDILRQRCDRLMKHIETSAATCHQRRTSLPNLRFDPRLPITQKRDELIAAIEGHRILIVSGETGSGKTTQLPKLCLLAGRGVRGIIGVTQPRRIAAMTVSQRIAEELGEALGKTVGYKIRFKETIQPHGRIKIMTDGILLAEAHQDPFLNQYDTLIVDEAHERSLNIDFTLGLLVKLLHRRRDLKLLITSATIDTEKFSKAFDNAPVIEVSGRLYPVETRYLDPDRSNIEDTSYIEQAVQAVERLVGERQRGDILIFMPTEQDIRDTCELLLGRRFDNTLVLPLFARLSAAEQQKVFHPCQGRKIIVATNVAETSNHHTRHPLCYRYGAGPHSAIHAALTHNHPAGGACFPKQRRPAHGTVRTRVQRCLHPPVQRRRLCPSPPLHSSGNSAFQPGRGNPAHDRPEKWGM